MVANYGLLVGKVMDKKEAQSTHDHYQILVDVNGTKNRAAVDVHSKAYPSAVDFVAVDPFNATVIDSLRNIGVGIYPGGIGGNGGLDFIRQNLFQRAAMQPLPIFSQPNGRDLNDQLDDYVDAAMGDAQSLIYLFGQLFEDTVPDPVFHFNPGRGIHDIHMNQGNIGRFRQDDGTNQDGGIILRLSNPERWIGLFLHFQSQSWNTDNDGHSQVKEPVAPGFFAR